MPADYDQAELKANRSLVRVHMKLTLVDLRTERVFKSS